MSGAPAHQHVPTLPTNVPINFRLARFHGQRPAPRSRFSDASPGSHQGMPNSAAIAIELLRRELMQLTAVVAEQNRLIQNMHDQLFAGSLDDDLVFEGSSANQSEPILPYTVGLGSGRERDACDCFSASRLSGRVCAS